MAKRERIKRAGLGFQFQDEQQMNAYNEGWAKMMVTILQEQIDRLNVNDTRHLRDSVHELISVGTVTTIEHRFLLYGLYAATGVGNGYKHGNGGNLQFLGDEYRNANGYGVSQVGAGLSESAMHSPKYKHKTIRFGKNAGKEAALTSGEKRRKADWFFRKYYYSLHRLNDTNASFFGEAYQGLTSTYLEQLFAQKGI